MKNLFWLTLWINWFRKTYLNELYSEVGLAEEAIKFSVYNAGKFLQNLGYDSPFTEEETRIEPEIFNQLSARADENHDFFRKWFILCYGCKWRNRRRRLRFLNYAQRYYWSRWKLIKNQKEKFLVYFHLFLTTLIDLFKN